MLPPWAQAAHRALSKVLKAAVSRVFREPVNIKYVPDYYEVVTKPMDLGTVRSKLERGMYHTSDAMLQDVEQIWENCRLYNEKGDEVYNLGVECEARFATEWQAQGLPAKGAGGGGGMHDGQVGGYAIPPPLAYHVPGAGVKLEERHVLMPALPLAAMMPPAPQPGPPHGPPFAPRPLVAPPPPLGWAPPPPPPPDWATRALQVVDSVMNLEDAGAFCEPVPHDVPKYYETIRYAMDLGTVRARLMQGRYNHPREVLSDVAYVWSNCREFNEPGSDIVACAEQCQRVFDRNWLGSGLTL